jgi:hypothetical protein
MTTLCGIDFSESSARASAIAAKMAVRLKADLMLARGEAESSDESLSHAERALEGRASSLRDFG